MKFTLLEHEGALAPIEGIGERAWAGVRDLAHWLEGQGQRPIVMVVAIDGACACASSPSRPSEPLRWLTAAVGRAVRLIDVDDVCYFQSDTKYTRVVTADAETLIQRSLHDIEALGQGSAVDARDIGRRLGVRHVLTGSVSGDGQRVQVTARLSRTDTGAVLWTERFLYDSPRQWNWRQDISRRVAATLNVRLHAAAFERPVTGGPSGEGIERWLQGQFMYKAMKSRDQMVSAREHFEAAVRAEPQSVNALTGLALTHVCLVLYRWSDDRAADIAAAKVLARRALEIDPEHPIALRAMGQAFMFAGEFDEAQRAFERMIAVSPNDPDAYRGMASVLYMTAQWDRVAAHAEQALELSPLDPANRWRAHTLVAGTMLALRRDDEAHQHARLAVEADPNVPHLHFGLAAIQGLRGDLAPARESIARGLALLPDYSIAKARATAVSRHPVYVAQMLERQEEGLRLAGLREHSPVASAAKR